MARKVNTATRAAAIADLQAGEQPAIVAERYSLDQSTVRVWKNRYVTEPETLRPVSSPPVQLAHERQKQQIGELVLDLLAAKLKASAALAEAVSSPEWLARQSGSELAALGEWLDTTALALGDRLAGRRAAGDDAGDSGG